MSRMKLVTMILMTVTLVVAPAAWSAEIFVSDGADYRPSSPAATQLLGSALLVAWESPGEGIVARRLGPGGAPIEGRVVLAADAAAPGVPFEGRVVANKQPAVAPVRNGYLLLWTREVSDLSADVFYQQSTLVSSTIVGQRFTAAGRPAGEPFRVSDAGAAGAAQAVRLADGRIAVVWHAAGDGADGVHARVLAPDGGTATAAFRVDDGLGEARRPALAAAADGGFLVAWDGCCDAGGDRGIHARLFAADASPIGGAFGINTGAEGDQVRPVLAALATGGYMAAWYGPRPGGTVWDNRVYAQALGAAGEHLGIEAAVSEGAPGRAHTAPAIATAPGGGVLVGWTAWRGWFQWAVFARQVSPLGLPLPGVARLSDGPINGQHQFVLTSTANGGYLAAWAGFDRRDQVAIATEVLGPLGLGGAPAH